MKRRDFLKLSAGSLFLNAGISSFFSQTAQAENIQLPTGFPTSIPKILINVTLDGGPDLRHLMPPKYDSNPNSYGYLYWKYRANAHAIAQHETAYQARWENDFLKPSKKLAPAGKEFGILNNSQWLFDQWESGNLAIINNALGSNSRDHAHSLLVLEQGNRNASPHDLDRAGWGGRLAAAIQSKLQSDQSTIVSRIASLTPEVRRFSYCPHPTDPRKHLNNLVIDCHNLREMGLYDPAAINANASVTGLSSIMSRSLKAYYAAKRDEIDKNSPYFKFIQHEQDLRNFGELIRARLIGANPESPLISTPPVLRALVDEQYAQQNNLPTINSNGFGEQIMNLYDALACQDILNFRVVSMAYRGWDSHKNQKRYIEQRFYDLFGDKGAISTLYSLLPSSITDQFVWVFSGEFGRQLKANGDNGTDHGRGNSVLVVGKAVSGGLYGDLFSQAELDRIETRSPDIIGQTAIERIFATVCEIIEPNTGNVVFSNVDAMPLETNVAPQLFLA
ncbi:MAG: hypothetical protein RIT27_1717 [Pseudomonadota bacterium]|jgi:uncharacterized protein (DUF1501 family)